MTPFIKNLGPTGLRLGMGIWPPFFGAGIRVDRIQPDWQRITVSMPLRWYNKNYFGTHYGGSLFSMTDPFYALMIVKNLGRGYYVWDRSSRIDFLKPGRGRVRAEFEINAAIIELILAQTAKGNKYHITLPVDIRDTDDDVVARVYKTLYIRPKKARESD